MNVPNVTKQIVGGAESQVFVGIGPHLILNGMRGFALTVRTQGTIIAWCICTDEGGVPTAYVPTWVTIVLNQGDYFVAARPITQFQMTAAADSVVIHCDRNF